MIWGVGWRKVLKLVACGSACGAVFCNNRDLFDQQIFITDTSGEVFIIQTDVFVY
jgi:hypothetical protein